MRTTDRLAMHFLCARRKDRDKRIDDVQVRLRQLLHNNNHVDHTHILSNPRKSSPSPNSFQVFNPRKSSPSLEAFILSTIRPG